MNNPLPPELTVTKAVATEMPTVCRALASAFTHDPVLTWLSGKTNIYASLFRSEAEALYKHHGQVYINQSGNGAAMWLPPGVSSQAPFHWRLLLTPLQLFFFGGLQSLKRGQQVEQLMSVNHLTEPHFYLHAIGASLGSQGRGIGSALLKAGLADCDKQSMPAYLESSNKKNNPLYQRYGFEVIGESSLPDNGPKIWFMRREAS